MSSTNPSRAPSSARILTWLNPRRLWWQGLVLAVGIWSVVLIDFATPSAVDRAGNIKFQDFLPFYVSGVLASQHRTSDFYSQQVTSRLMAGIVPAAAHVKLPFLYGPQVALFFEPFAGLPFPLAAWLWVAINVILYALCSLALWRDCDRLR